MYGSRISIGILPLMLSISMITILPVESDSDSWTITRLTNNSVYDVDPYISPDGSKVVFIEDLDGNPYTESDWEIMLIDLNTMEMKRVTNNYYSEEIPSITRDGSKIVFQDSYVFTIESIRSDGTGLDQLSSYFVYLPYLTSDNSKIIYTDTVGDSPRVVMMNLDGSNMVTVTNGGGYGDYPAKANGDGSKIVFCRNYDGYAVLCTINSDGTNLKEISTVPNYATFGITDDGSKVVYTKLMDDGGYRAAIYDTNTDTETLVGPSTSTAPFISGDDSQIAYLFRQGGDLYLRIVDGPDIYLGPSSLYSYLYIPSRYASISQDGSRIAFVSCKDGNPEIYLATKEGFQLSSSFLNNFFVPSFSYYITTIIFESEKSPLSTVTIPVTIKKAEDIGSMNLDLTYNPDILEVTDVIPGDLTQDSIIEKNIEDGRIRIGLIDTTGINGDGILFYIKFNVTIPSNTSSKTNNLGDIEGGRINIGSWKTDNLLHNLIGGSLDYSPLNIENAVVSDLDGNIIEVMTINGTFIPGAKKGDVNGDGVITSVDALMALKMSVGELEVNLVADMDDDGQVLANDALQIMNMATQFNVQKAVDMIKGGGLGNFGNFGGFGGG